MSGAPQTNKIVFYAAQDAAPILEDGMMSPPDIPLGVLEALDIMPLIEGERTSVLFKGSGPEGWSLTHASFGCGFMLPRHSHNADCLYYVLKGEIHMGSRVVPSGDGFFVRAGAPYTYQAGPEGVEVLEFRTSTQFDMRITDLTVEDWEPVVAAAHANRESWN